VTSGRVVFGLVAIAVFVLDRVTKSVVAASIPFGTEVPVIGHLVGIANVRNSGAAFGLVPAAAGIFLIASVAVAIGLVVYVARTPTNLPAGAVLGLILGGTIGNGFDRLVFGTVTDFVNFHFFPVFNVADSAITIGVVALIASYVLRKSPAG
jgi:signal peptidase II